MVKVLTLNIAGLSLPGKRLAILNLLKDNDVDVACLQEVTFKQCQYLESAYTLFVNPGPRKRGTALLVRHGLQVSNLQIEPEGRLISADICNVTYICVYAPSGYAAREDRNDFFRKTVPAYFLGSKKPAVLLGDFNAVEESSDRRGNTTQPVNRTADNLAIREMVRVLTLKDAWKKLKPREAGFTRHTGRSSARIDRIYATENIDLQDIALGALSFGDHLPVIATIASSAPPVQHRPNYGLWKLNTSVLSEERYVDLITRFITRASRHPLREQDIGLWWERVFKTGIKNCSTKYCAQRAREKRETRAFFQECLLEILNADSLDWALYQEIRRELKAWEDECLAGYGVRARTKDGIMTDEPATLHHVKLCKRNYNRSSIANLSTPKGLLLADEESINREIVEHFTSIFKNQRSPDKTYAASFLDGVKGVFSHGPSSEQVSCALTAPFCTQEIKVAIVECKTNKAPGTDGIPYEFYLAFWDLVGPHFLDMMNHVLERKSVLPTQGKAAIRLIPKVPHPKCLSEYRPISLLNSDYKIIASVLAKRLRPTLCTALGTHQKGGVPGRYIFDSLCLYRDIIEETSRKSGITVTRDNKNLEHGAAIIGFDLEKAYDLVNRETLWETMSVMGYPASFIDWLKALYAITTISPLNGSSIVGDIEDAQSIRQGCPLSMHLFAVYIEPLLVRIAANVEGVAVNDQRVAVRGFVDDLAVFASSDYDIVTACKYVDEFCLWTHARVNRNKSNILGLGAWAWDSQRKKGAERLPTKEWPVQWLKPTPSMKLLGVEFQADIHKTSQFNWQKQLIKMLGIIRENYDRKMTLYGRVLFVKQHVLSLPVHLAHIIPCPPHRARAIEGSITSFVWGKRSRPATQCTQRPVLKGGLGFPNPSLFFHSLLTHTMYKALISPEGPERSVLRYWLATHLRHQLPDIFSNTARKSGEAPPAHITGVIPTIRALLQQGTITPTNHASSKAIYQALLEPRLAPGTLELQRPGLDWPSTWRSVVNTKGPNRDLMFLFNHDILPTRLRNQRHDPSVQAACPVCHRMEEDNIHCLLLCPEKRHAVDWLRQRLRTLGCNTPPRDAIHGHPGPSHNPRRTTALIEAFVAGTWTAKKRDSAPSVAELEDLWKALLLSKRITLPHTNTLQMLQTPPQSHPEPH